MPAILTLITHSRAFVLLEYLYGLICILVFTTSAGWVITEAKNPAITPQLKFCPLVRSPMCKTRNKNFGVRHCIYNVYHDHHDEQS